MWLLVSIIIKRSLTFTTQLMMNELSIVLLTLLLFVINASHCDLLTVRQTTNGPVEGIEQISSLGQKFYAFKGVPYAEPPITGIDPYTGEKVDRRFKAPVPLKRKWTENLKVQNFSDACIPSIHLFGIETKSSEDCLFMNIYVPADGVKEKSVLVWIHGGFFIGGEASDMVFGPDFLLSQDNIVIIVQYRLAIFGFLNLDFGQYTGNMGLKDQRLALKWIYNNIEKFSGKKGAILVFGVSAGGSSVNFHMLNEKSRKYFTRAFSLSGSAFSYFALSKGNHLKRIQECLKINDQTELIEYLKTADSKVLRECHTFNGFEKRLSSAWTPTIENPNTIDAFITKIPAQMYSSDKALAVDAMFSFTSQEYADFDASLVASREQLLKENVMESKLQLPFDGFDENTHPNEYERALKSLRDVYFPDTIDSDAIKRGNIDLLSDLNFGYGVLKAVIHQTNANNIDTDAKKKNTFLFRFGIDADLNVFKVKYQSKFDGAGHVEDLCYIFHCHMLDEMKVYDKHLEHRDQSYDAIMRMAKIITNFARTGDPSIEGDVPFKSCKSPAEIFCQEITNDSKSSVTINITEQVHYKTWNNIEDSIKK